MRRIVRAGALAAAMSAAALPAFAFEVWTAPVPGALDPAKHPARIYAPVSGGHAISGLPSGRTPLGLAVGSPSYVFTYGNGTYRSAAFDPLETGPSPGGACYHTIARVLTGFGPRSTLVTQCD